MQSEGGLIRVEKATNLLGLNVKKTKQTNKNRVNETDFLLVD